MDNRLSKDEVRTLALSSLGGTLEFYDFIIFAFFANYFSGHFFPATLGKEWQLINTWGAFAAGYLARPLGGVVMAHFGDKFGRKNMFMLSILLMVIPTFALAFIPTFETIGYAAPIVLLLVRVFQGIAIGGELPGAWVFVKEHSGKNNSGAYLGILTASVVGGILLGSIVALLIAKSFEQKVIEEWAWRIPFGIGGVFGIVSIYLRKFLSETPVFKKMQEQKAINKFPLGEVLKNYKFGIFVSFFITWVLTACIVVMVLQAPNFTQWATKITPIDKTYMQMCGIVFVSVGCICVGALSDHFKISNVCWFFGAGFGIFGFSYFYWIYHGGSTMEITLLYLMTCFFAGVMNCTPMIMCEIFPSHVRFSGLSFSYNIAYAAAGAITPMLVPYIHMQAVKIIEGDESINTVYLYLNGGYIAVIGVVAVLCAILVRKKM